MFFIVLCFVLFSCIYFFYLFNQNNPTAVWLILIGMQDLKKKNMIFEQF